MAVFRYTGKTRAGAAQRGEIEASDRASATAVLRQRQILVTSIRVKPKELKIKIPGFGNKITEQEVVIFTRQFATMIDAGLPLVQCLDILARQSENKEFARIIGQVKTDVESGDSFADALRKHPKAYSDFYVNMVEAGEAGGILDTILTRLAAYMEKAAALKSEVKGAMVYPAVIIGIAPHRCSVLTALCDSGLRRDVFQFWWDAPGTYPVCHVPERSRQRLHSVCHPPGGRAHLALQALL